MQELIEKVQEIVAFELNRANTIHPPKFNSMHEAYAVILEELEEAEREISIFKGALEWSVWSNIKDDCYEMACAGFKDIEKIAIAAAAEMIQVAAMCRKARRNGKEEV